MAYLGKRFLFAAVSIVCLSQAGAVSNFLGLNGRNLLTLCTSDSKDSLSACEGYLLGVQDTMHDHRFGFLFSTCFPAGVSVTQMRIELIRKLESSKIPLSAPAVEFVVDFLNEKYGCISQR